MSLQRSINRLDWMCGLAVHSLLPLALLLLAILLLAAPALAGSSESSESNASENAVDTEVDFAQQKERLLAVLTRLKEAGPDDGVRHPLFGEMTAAEKGWAGYKHLDHHLRQFGV